MPQHLQAHESSAKGTDATHAAEFSQQLGLLSVAMSHLKHWHLVQWSPHIEPQSKCVHFPTISLSKNRQHTQHQRLL